MYVTRVTLEHNWFLSQPHERSVSSIQLNRLFKILDVKNGIWPGWHTDFSFNAHDIRDIHSASIILWTRPNTRFYKATVPHLVSFSVSTFHPRHWRLVLWDLCWCACVRACINACVCVRLQWSSPLLNMSHVSCSLHSVVSLKENVW